MRRGNTPLSQLSHSPDLNSMNCYLIFFVNVRRKTGDEYEPSTLRGFYSSISRYLSSCKYYDSDQTIMNYPTFSKALKALAAKQKELKSQGKGSRPRKARSLTNEEVDKLFDEGVFTLENPEGLIWLNFWNMCSHFGVRPGLESRSILWKDVTVHKNNVGKEYAMLNERQTKTHSGIDCRNIIENRPKMYATSGDANNPRDPVSAYKKYAAMRPANLGENSAFYLGIG